MKSKLGNIVSVLTILTALLSCTTEPLMNQDDPADRKTVFDDFILKSSTIYFGDERGKYCDVIDTNTVIIKSDIPQALMPEVGEVIFVPLSESAPNGFLGKVGSVSDADGDFIIKTHEVSLEEVFEELHIDQTISISKLMDNVLDEEGNLIECGILPDEVWNDTHHVMDSLSMIESQSESFTKADFGNSRTFTRSIPFEYESISGEIVLSSSLSIKLDISKGTLQEYDISLSKKSFINAVVGIENKGETKIPVLKPKTFRLPLSFNVGPIVLKPALVYSLDFLASGNIKFGANIGLGLEDVNTRWHNGETITTFGEGNPTYISAYYLDAEGSFGLEARIAIQFGVFGQEFLAFGVDAIPSMSVGLAGKLGMEDKELLRADLKADLSLNCSCGIYMYCKFLSSRYDKIRASIDMPGREWELDILDKGSGFNVKKSSEEWAVSGSFADNQFMSVNEKGIALFRKGDDDNPMDMKMLFSKSTSPEVRATTSGSDNEVVFTIMGNPSEYEVRPYNLVRSGYGEYFYFGNPIVKLIKRIEVDGDEIHYYDFEYDSNNRLSKVSTYNEGVWNYSYYEDRIVFRGGFDTVTGYLDEKGRLTKTIDEYNDGEISNTTITSFSYDDNNNPTISTGAYTFSNGNHIEDTGWRTYEYGDDIDNLNLDIFHAMIADCWLDEIIPFFSFPHIHNKNLCTGFTNYHEQAPTEHFNIEYSFDESGNIESIYISSAYSDVTIRLCYY